MGLLTQKRALVTGGSRGIGRAIVEEMAKEGADVAFTYRQSKSEAGEVAQAIMASGRRAIAVQADVRDFQLAQEVVQQVVDRWHRLDILINNAGILLNQSIWSLDESVWDAVVDVNLKGTFNYIRAVADLFRTQKSGKIISIASIHGLRVRADGSSYAGAKAGIIGLSQSVARELGPAGVNVNVVAPGLVETDMLRTLPDDIRRGFLSDTAMGRIGEPEDVAFLVSFLASDRARHIHGEVIKVDGGQYI